jgi:hypothetical protein
MGKNSEEQQFSDDEIALRRDDIIRRMANTPPQPKTKEKPDASPKKRGRPATEKKKT